MCKYPVEFSQELLLSAKKGEDIYITEEFKNLDAYCLRNFLFKDSLKKVFWINLYNALSILSLKNHNNLLTNPFQRLRHFKRKIITLGQKSLSLDDIEHGMLRKSLIWWSKGYLKKTYISNFEKEFRIQQRDARIHFALNCGAESCPPIRFYENDHINEQLDTATYSFLESQVKKDSRNNSVWISSLFNFYSGDFGGKNGIKNFLSYYGFYDKTENLTIKYLPYSWKEDTNNFK